MKKMVPALSLLVALAAAPLSLQLITSKLIFISPGSQTRDDIAVTRDGQRIYFQHDTTELFMYDRRVKREVRILAGHAANFDLELSSAGDRLAFSRRGENGEEASIWTLALDPKTGLAAGAPRRVTFAGREAKDPAFSPDGMSIAFAMEGSDTSSYNNVLVVVPTAGGREREVTRVAGDIWPIQWSPDARSIFFGQSFDEEPAAARNGIYHVAVNGGSPQLVARADSWAGVPGLSPDGRALVFVDPSGDSAIAATADGVRMASYELTGEEHKGLIWMSNTHTVDVVLATPRIINVQSLVNGSNRQISNSAFEAYSPKWSPDGQRIAAASGSSGGAGVRIEVLNASGGVSRVLRTQHWINAPTLEWSPDGKSFVYRGPNAARGGMTVLDAVTGAERFVVRAASGTVEPQWRSDSRAILYSTIDSVAAAPFPVTIHEINTGGADRVLRTLPLHCRNYRQGCNATFVNDSLLVTWDVVKGAAASAAASREYRLFNFRSVDSGRVVYNRAGATGYLRPTFSADGRFMAVRHEAPNGEHRLVEVIALNGTARRTLTMPFVIEPGRSNPWVSPDGRALIVVAGEPQDSVVTIYRVDVSSGRSTKLTSVKRTNQVDQNIAISPDGRSVAYATVEAPYTAFYEIDLSLLLKGAAAPRR